MINLFIPLVFPIAAGILFLLFGKRYKGLLFAIIILSILFGILVYALRLTLPISEIEVIRTGGSFNELGITLEFSRFTIILSIVVYVLSLIILIFNYVVVKNREWKMAILAVMPGLCAMAIQSTEMLNYIVCIFLLSLLFIIYSYDKDNSSSFACLRLLTGIFIAVILFLIAMGSSLMFYPGGNIILHNILSGAPAGRYTGIIMMLMTLSASIFAGIFPFNIFAYDFISALKQEEKGGWLLFISLPSIVFIFKLLNSCQGTETLNRALFFMAIISFAFSVLSLFVKKNVNDLQANIMFAVSSEILLMLLYGIIYKESVFSIFAILSIIPAVFMILSLGAINAKDITMPKGSFKKNPFNVLTFLVSAFSIALIPPSIGFISKFSMISGLLSNKQLFVAVVLIVLFAIESYVFLRIIFSMFITDSTEKTQAFYSRKVDIIIFAASVLAVIAVYSGQKYLYEASITGYENSFGKIADNYLKDKLRLESESNLKQFIIE
jgi:formate hydrogenlyase subunit 3/multisubunit Na+/H+ antiporter MnhD subunit